MKCEGILSKSLAEDYGFLDRYVEYSMDETLNQLLESETLRFFLLDIEKVSRELSTRGIRGNNKLDAVSTAPGGFLFGLGLDAVSAATDGFLLGLGAAWELEPHVEIEQLNQVLADESIKLKSLHENIQVNGHPNVASEQWDKFSEAGLDEIPGMHRLLSHAVPELGFDINAPESENVIYWGGVGSLVFIKATKIYLATTYDSQLAALGKGGISINWFDNSNGDG